MIAMDLPAVPDFLPPGWARTEPHPGDGTMPRAHPEHEHPRPVGGPPMSGVITTVTSRTGTPVTIHRADYDVISSSGGWTVHGYAWRCPCRRTALGYRAEQFAQALGDARDHECGGPS